VTGVRHLYDVGGARGVDADLLLAGTGLAAVPSDQVTAWQELAIARNLARLLPDTVGLGVTLGRRLHMVSYGAAGLAGLASSTPRTAIMLARHFPQFLPVLARTSLEMLHQRTALRFDGSRLPDDVRRMLLERDLIAVATALREVAGRPLTGLVVDLEFERDAAHEELVDALQVTPTYGAPVTRLVVDDALLDAPTAQRDADAFVEAMTRSADLLDRFPAHTSTRGQVLDILRATPGPPRLETVAATLLTTPRTLRRRLTSEGTSFRALAEDARRARADVLLAEGRLSIEQIAGQLGYADSASFSHAYKRWTGTSPRSRSRLP
jgi:AraC-like DNA-binding protein